LSPVFARHTTISSKSENTAPVSPDKYDTVRLYHVVLFTPELMAHVMAVAGFDFKDTWMHPGMADAWGLAMMEFRKAEMLLASLSVALMYSPVAEFWFTKSFSLIFDVVGSAATVDVPSKM
jgi:hypothetical protein